MALGVTHQDVIESGYEQRILQVLTLQTEIDWRERQRVPVPQYILDEYDDVVRRASAYALRYGLEFDASDYVA